MEVNHSTSYPAESSPSHDHEITCPECVRLAQATLEDKVSTITDYKSKVKEKIAELSKRQLSVLKLSAVSFFSGLATILCGSAACMTYENTHDASHCVTQTSLLGTALISVAIATFLLHGSDVAAEKQEAKNSLLNESLHLHSVCLKGDAGYFQQRLTDLEENVAHLAQADQDSEAASFFSATFLDSKKASHLTDDEKAEILNFSEELLEGVKEVKLAYEQKKLETAAFQLYNKVAPLEEKLLTYAPDDEARPLRLPVSAALEHFIER